MSVQDIGIKTRGSLFETLAESNSKRMPNNSCRNGLKGRAIPADLYIQTKYTVPVIAQK